MGYYSECEYLICGGFFGTTYRCSKNKDEQVSSSRYDNYCKEDSRYRTDDCEYYRDTGSICFITLSCLRQKLGNHCLELENLRTFRDSYMAKTDDGRMWIKKYYKLSPAIVKAINRKPDNRRIWDDIYHNYVVPCVKMIRKDDPEANAHAMENMTTMLCELSHEYL